MIKLLTLSPNNLERCSRQQNRWYFNFGQNDQRNNAALWYNSISDVYDVMQVCIIMGGGVPDA